MAWASDFSQEKLNETINRTIAYEMSTVTNPAYGSVAGEWMVLGMARNGTIDTGYQQIYLGNLQKKLDDCGGVLSSTRCTDYSRVVLAVSALGMDAGNVYGYPVLGYLGDYEKVTAPGISGAAFALLALDSRKYPEPARPADAKIQTTRDLLIQYLLKYEAGEGGWSVSGDVADVDMTAIVLTALSPYRESYPSVGAAVERGINILSKLQRKNGGYQSYGVYNSESLSQVLVAMSTLRIDVADERFTKNGITVLDALLAFQNEDGSFAHIQGMGANGMATEQALYALVALSRMKQGQKSLYDMTDGMVPEQTLQPTMTIGTFLERCQKISETPVIDDETEVNLLLMEYTQHDLFENKEAVYQKLQRAKEYIAVQKQTVDALSTDIWNQIDPLRVNQNSEAVVKALLERYTALQKSDQKHVKYAGDLIAAGEILNQLDKGIIPKQILDNMEQTKESFFYEGTIKKKISYSIKIPYHQIKEKRDFSVKLKKGKKKSANLPKGAVGFCFGESGELPAICKLSVSGLAENGVYTLYHVKEASKKENTLHTEERISRVKVHKGIFTVKLGKGGQYYLMAKSAENRDDDTAGADQNDNMTGQNDNSTTDQNDNNMPDQNDNNTTNQNDNSTTNQIDNNMTDNASIDKASTDKVSTDKAPTDNASADNNQPGNSISGENNISGKNSQKQTDAAKDAKGKAVLTNRKGTSPETAKKEKQSVREQNSCMISKERLEAILGKDENIEYEEKVGEGNPYAYRVVINGTDLKRADLTSAEQMNLKLSFETTKENEILELADEPFIFCFDKETILGTVFVQIETNMPDGTYLLCNYDAENKTAEIMKKVQVEDGALRCTVSKAGICFITRRLAVTNIVNEDMGEAYAEDDLRDTTKEIKNEETALEEQAAEANTRNADYRTAIRLLAAGSRVEMIAIAGILGLLVLAGGLLLIRRRLE